MNSAMKPGVLTSSGQNPSPGHQLLNKPLQQQPPQNNPPATYGQPMPQNMHHHHHHGLQHPNPAHQANHYSSSSSPSSSLNVPQHYNSSIPVSNHPVAAQQQQQQQQAFPGGAAAKGAYQPNLGHQPHVAGAAAPPPPLAMPPVSQTLPATTAQQPVLPAEVPPLEKVQSNGEVQVRPLKTTSESSAENHVATPVSNRTQSPDKATSSLHQTEQKKASATSAISEPATASGSNKEKSDEEKPRPAESPSSSSAISLINHSNSSNSSSSKGSDSQTGISAKVESIKKTVVESAPSEATPPVKDKEGVSKKDESDSKDDVVVVVAKGNKAEHKESKTPPKSASTPRTPTRKSKTPKDDSVTPTTKASQKVVDTFKPIPPTKSPSLFNKAKRTRTRTQPYQSPLPEIEIVTKISTQVTPRNKTNDDKLMVFFKNEFLAVRNSEGSFYVCQAVQNVYRSSAKIRIRWLSQDKEDKSGEIYTPDFYDNTDFDCILTNLNLTRVEKGKFRLPPHEKERTDSILKRSLAVEKGEVTSPSLTEEHPDGIDLSLYKEESQLKKRKRAKRKAGSPLRAGRSASKSTTPSTKSPDTPKSRKIAVSKKKKKPVATVTTTTTSNSNKKSRPALTAAAKKAMVSAPIPRRAIVSSINTSRNERAKRRQDTTNQTSYKEEPKKVAKLAPKKEALSKLKSVKTTKAAISKVTVQKSPPAPPQKATLATRKTKRSGRK